MGFVRDVFAGYGVLAIIDELFGRRAAATVGISVIVACLMISVICRICTHAMKEQKGRE